MEIKWLKGFCVPSTFKENIPDQSCSSNRWTPCSSSKAVWLSWYLPKLLSLWKHWLQFTAHQRSGLWFGDHQRSGSGQRFGILEIQKVWLWPKDLYKPLLEDCLIKMTIFNEKDLLNPRTRMWGKWRGRLNERFASSRKYVWKSWDYQTFKDHFWPYLVYSHIAISPVPTTLVIVYCCRYDKRWSSVE